MVLDGFGSLLFNTLLKFFLLGNVFFANASAYFESCMHKGSKLGNY